MTAGSISNSSSDNHGLRGVPYEHDVCYLDAIDQQRDGTLWQLTVSLVF